MPSPQALGIALIIGLLYFGGLEVVKGVKAAEHAVVKEVKHIFHHTPKPAPPPPAPAADPSQK